MPIRRSTAIAKFWARGVASASPSHVTLAQPCLLWTGRIQSGRPRKGDGGYGDLTFDGKPHTRVHRLAWLLTYGPIPDGKHVLHRCDVRHCFEPTHLFLGTMADNNADRDAKHRMPRGVDHWARRHPEWHGGRGRGTSMSMSCVECGTVVRRKPSALQGRTVTYCSKRCVATMVNRKRWHSDEPDNTKRT